ncbi:MAG: EFR1 family ferrodoxin [Oscillospiraceae bacterium]|nr:EFR1 family ferrodoxin [Oscillospiraceae bacterium]
MLTLYFSATGNTKYIARLFSKAMGATCLSIEEEADFRAEITAHDTIAFCYPIYASRAPLIMRRFVTEHAELLRGKKLAIFATQVAFSGDGARSLLDLLPSGHVEVVYAEHFNMPNNVCNLWPLFRRQSKRGIARRFARADGKIAAVSADMQAGRVKRRGFSRFSRVLGKLQAPAWLRKGERIMGQNLKINDNCTACNLCVSACPMRNLENEQDKIVHKNNCTVCYRCVNLCPQRAITVFLHQKLRWQYRGLPPGVRCPSVLPKAKP